MEIEGKTVDAGVSVAEDRDGHLFYNANIDSLGLWGQKKGNPATRATASLSDSPSSEGEPKLDPPCDTMKSSLVE